MRRLGRDAVGFDFSFMDFILLDGGELFAGPSEGGDRRLFGAAEFLVPVGLGRRGLGGLFLNRADVFVLFVQRLGYRVGCGEDGLILGEGGRDGRGQVGGSFLGDFTYCKLNGWLRSRRLLRVALVFRNRLAGQQDRGVSGRRAGGLSSGKVLARRGAFGRRARKTFRAALGRSLCGSVRASFRSSIWSTV